MIGATGIAIATTLVRLDQRCPARRHAAGSAGSLPSTRPSAAACSASVVATPLHGGRGVRRWCACSSRWFAPANGLLVQAVALIAPRRRRGLLVYLGAARAARRGQLPRSDQGPAAPRRRLATSRAPVYVAVQQCEGRVIMQGRPRRSVLYMPGSNERALEKAKTIPADALIFDLEDAVAPDAKVLAREQVCAAVKGGGYGGREIVIRRQRARDAVGHRRICSPPAMPSPTPSSCRRWCIPATSSAPPRSCKACMPRRRSGCGR